MQILLSRAEALIAEMAEEMKKSTKPMHPPFSRMVCEAMHSMDEGHEEHPGHSLQSLKKYVGDHYQVMIGVLRQRWAAARPCKFFTVLTRLAPPKIVSEL